MDLLRWLGLARLPVEADALIPPDQRKIVSEHLFCSVTLRNFRAPGRACTWKRQWFTGAIAVSDKRLIAFRWSQRLINVAFNDNKFAALHFAVEGQTLVIAHDAALNRDDWSGSIECRFRTADADQIVNLIRSTANQNLTSVQ